MTAGDAASFRQQRGDGCEKAPLPLTVCVAANPLIKPVQSGLTGLLTGLAHRSANTDTHTHTHTHTHTQDTNVAAQPDTGGKQCPKSPHTTVIKSRPEGE